MNPRRGAHYRLYLATKSASVVFQVESSSSSNSYVPPGVISTSISTQGSLLLSKYPRPQRCFLFHSFMSEISNLPWVAKPAANWIEPQRPVFAVEQIDSPRDAPC